MNYRVYAWIPHCMPVQWLVSGSLPLQVAQFLFPQVLYTQQDFGLCHYPDLNILVPLIPVGFCITLLYILDIHPTENVHPTNDCDFYV